MGIGDVPALAVCVIFALVFPLMFLVRLVGAIFSTGARQRIREHPFVHLGWLIYTIAAIYFFFVIPQLMVRDMRRRQLKEQAESSNQASATSEAAPGAASSSPQR